MYADAYVLFPNQKKANQRSSSFVSDLSKLDVV